jgi:hypothetical protein
MTSTTSDRAGAIPRRRPDDRPVLAVVFDDATAAPVLDRAATAAGVLDAPLMVALLHPRDGFSTDAALLARTAGRRRQRLQTLLAGLRQWTGPQPVGVLLPYGWRPRRSRHRMFARLVTGKARGCEARLVVIPGTLERTVARLPVPAIVVGPSTASTPEA